MRQQEGVGAVAFEHTQIIGRPVAQTKQAELSGGREDLQIEYLPSFNYGPWPEAEFELWQAGHLLEERRWPWDGDVSVAQIADALTAELTAQRSRELAAGMTLVGPHRDDLRFLANGRDLRAYGSRGQQRSAALSLKLAEVQAMTDATGSAPLLLLDDVMSELDAQRRSALLAALDGVDQAVITTTDWEDFTPEFRAAAQCMHVCAGTVTDALG